MNKENKELLSGIILSDECQNIINEDQFYFEKARETLGQFENYDNNDLIINLSNASYEEIKELSYTDKDINNLLAILNKLVAYCDTKAKDKLTLNDYSDKRAFARAGIYQPDWIKHLLLYKTDKQKTSPSIINAIDFIKDPLNHISILSENHRKMISSGLLNKKYNRDSFIKDIYYYFSELKLATKHPENITHLFARMIYSVKDQWNSSIEGLMAQDTTGWQDDLVQDITVNNNAILWWDKQPAKGKETIDGLNEKLSKDGFFYFYFFQSKQATHRARVIDFCLKDNYPDKVKSWHEYKPTWFHDDINDYSENPKSQPNILFLIDDFVKLQPGIDQEDFDPYKECKYPHMSNLVPYSSIINPEKINDNMIAEILEILKQKKQIIIQGAPGTGKTYVTAALALAILGENVDGSFESIMRKYDELSEQGFIKFTTFHQSMDYEDFIEGLRPEVLPEKSEIIYDVKSGIFKKICTETLTPSFSSQYNKLVRQLEEEGEIRLKTIKESTPFKIILNSSGNLNIKSGNKIDSDHVSTSVTKEKLKENNPEDQNISYIESIREYLHRMPSPRVLIIDEINRGNISRIFGELITLLETDKRQGAKHSLKVVLPYSQENFSVPSDLYIIGTMNTTDRSIGHIDYAIRRRFAFYTMHASEEAVNNHYETLNLGGSELSAVAIKLFRKIRDYISNNNISDLSNEDLIIGHSYFMANNENELAMKIKYEVFPLLQEYDKDGLVEKSDFKLLFHECLDLINTLL